MTLTSYNKDAETLINFFDNLQSEYEKRYEGRKEFISFCLEVLNVKSFDIYEIERALSDLNSISLVIQRNISGVLAERFECVVRQGISRLDMWLHNVHNHRIDASDGDLLFGSMKELKSVADAIGRKVLTEDYFKSMVDADESDTFQLNIAVASIGADDEDASKCATDIISVDDGVVSLTEVDIPWTDREAVWLGSRTDLANMLNAKYTKAKDKRLIAIIKQLYAKLGDKILYKSIKVEPKALQGNETYELDTSYNEDNFIMCIRKK